MKKASLLLFLLLPFFLSSQIVFEREYVSTGHTSVNDIRQTADGGYIVVGYSEDTVNNYYSALIMRLDMFGDTLWTNKISGGFGQVAFGVQEIDSGNFIVTGYKNYSSSSDCDVNLIKINAAGNLVWQRPFGGSNCQWGQAIIRNVAGNFMIGGDKMYIRDPQGNFISSSAFAPFQIMGIQQTSDGNYIVCGMSSTLVYLEKRDTGGAVIWTKSFPGDMQNPSSHMVAQTSDGGYILSCTVANTTSMQLIKTNSIGDTLWTKQFGTSVYANGVSVQQTTDGGYIVAGETYDGTLDQMTLTKTDMNGNVLWTRFFGDTTRYSWSGSVQQTSDGGYVIGGTIENSNYTAVSFYVVKTDGAGYAGVKEIKNAEPLIAVYPNPVQNTTVISWNSPTTFEEAEFILTDMMGKEVRRIALTAEQTVFSKENLPAGMYVYRVANDKNIFGTGKIVVR